MKIAQTLTQSVVKLEIDNNNCLFESIELFDVDFYFVKKTLVFNECTFTKCSFNECDLSRFEFDNCKFVKCDFSRANFATIDISNCKFRQCNFTQALMKECIFCDAEKNIADVDHFNEFNQAQLPDIIPSIPNIHQAVYEAATATDESLEMSDWHTCNTVHCAAGWVVHLAGEPGYALEELVEVEAAAKLIYWKSDPTMTLKKFPDFYGERAEAELCLARLAGIR